MTKAKFRGKIIDFNVKKGTTSIRIEAALGTVKTTDILLLLDKDIDIKIEDNQTELTEFKTKEKGEKQKK